MDLESNTMPKPPNEKYFLFFNAFCQFVTQVWNCPFCGLLKIRRFSCFSAVKAFIFHTNFLLIIAYRWLINQCVYFPQFPMNVICMSAFGSCAYTQAWTFCFDQICAKFLWDFFSQKILVAFENQSFWMVKIATVLFSFWRCWISLAWKHRALWSEFLSQWRIQQWWILEGLFLFDNNRIVSDLFSTFWNEMCRC